MLWRFNIMFGEGIGGEVGSDRCSAKCVNPEIIIIVLCVHVSYYITCNHRGSQREANQSVLEENHYNFNEKHDEKWCRAAAIQCRGQQPRQKNTTTKGVKKTRPKATEVNRNPATQRFFTNIVSRADKGDERWAG